MDAGYRQISGNRVGIGPKEAFGLGRLVKPPDEKKNFDIREVHTYYHEIARRLVIGQKTAEIAKALNVHPNTVRNAKNSPVIQEQLRIMGGARDHEAKNVAKQIRELAPKCVEVLEGILNDEEVGNGLKVKTSLAILDRAGHSVPKNVNMRAVHAIVTKDDLSRIKERALEIGIEESA